jgi:hypothetical protein
LRNGTSRHTCVLGDACTRLVGIAVRSQLLSSTDASDPSRKDRLRWGGREAFPRLPCFGPPRRGPPTCGMPGPHPLPRRRLLAAVQLGLMVRVPVCCSFGLCLHDGGRCGYCGMWPGMMWWSLTCLAEAGSATHNDSLGGQWGPPLSGGATAPACAMRLMMVLVCDISPQELVSLSATRATACDGMRVGNCPGISSRRTGDPSAEACIPLRWECTSSAWPGHTAIGD